MASQAFKQVPDFPQDTPLGKHVNLALIVFPMTTAVFFGVGIVSALLIRPLVAHPYVSIPAVMIAAGVLGAISAWVIAPRMRARFGPARLPPSGDAPRD